MLTRLRCCILPCPQGKASPHQYPAFGPLWTCNSPPTAEARSCIPRMPSDEGPGNFAGLAPLPLSSMLSSRSSCDVSRRMSQREARECRATLVRASWMILKTAVAGGSLMASVEQTACQG